MWSRTRKKWYGCWLALVLFGITVLCGGNDAMAAGNTTIENKALATSLFQCYNDDAFKDKISVGDNSGTDLNNYKPVDVLMKKDKKEVNAYLGGLNGYLDEAFYKKCYSFMDDLLEKKV